VPNEIKEGGKLHQLTWEEKPQSTFEAFTSSGTQAHTHKKVSEKGNKASGKLERGVNEDSSFRLTVPDNAVTKSEVTMQLEHGTPTILVEIEGISSKLILDTGSNVSIVQPGVSRGDVRVTNMEPYGVTGDVR
jgi:hypothetical protein